MSQMKRSTRVFRRLIAVLLMTVVATPKSVGAASHADDLAPTRQTTEMHNLLGTCYAFQDIEGQLLPPLAVAAGSRWDRFDFRWNVIEGETSRLARMNFAPHDTIVDRDLSYGIDVIGILGSTPAWATESCHVRAQTDFGETGSPTTPLFGLSTRATDEAYWWRPCPPVGLEKAWDDPANVWGNYVYKTVTHFKDRVRVWEIWNEPDLGQTFWSGSVEEYAQLLKVGYLAVKAADPNATVLFGGLAYWSNPSYYVAVLDALSTLPGAAQNNHYFDALSLHLYSSVYQIRPIAVEIYANMASRVGPHPIWLTETGVPLWDEWPADTPSALRTNRATAREAAAYVIQAFAEARAIGIERFIFFRTHDENMTVGWQPDEANLPEYFGLIRNDLSLRPSYEAYRVAATYLQGENQVTGPFSRGGTRRITFWGTPDGRIDVLWNETGTPLTVTHPALLPAATIVDMEGNTAPSLAANEHFTLTLSPATANTASDGSYLIGGPPLLVVQEDTTPPTSTLRALPQAHCTNTLTLTWDVVDEGTGYWYSEIEGANAPDGPWQPLLGWSTTQGLTQAQVTVPAAGNWHFRGRARDGAGNWELWPAAAETKTSVILTRTVALSATAYLDDNGNRVWDTDEVPATQATLTWRTKAGQVVTHTVGSSAHITLTVEAGDYLLTTQVPGHIRAEVALEVPPGLDIHHVNLLLALQPVRGQAYLPLVTRQP